MYHEAGGVGARATSIEGSHFCTSSSKLPKGSLRGDTKVEVVSCSAIDGALCCARQEKNERVAEEDDDKDSNLPRDTSGTPLPVLLQSSSRRAARPARRSSCLLRMLS